jgi:hypothetical protein
VNLGGDDAHKEETSRRGFNGSSGSVGFNGFNGMTAIVFGAVLRAFNLFDTRSCTVCRFFIFFLSPRTHSTTDFGGL